MPDREEETAEILEQLYAAFLAGDPEVMLGLLSDDVSLRFLGQVDTRGIEGARRFFTFAGGLLQDVHFEIHQKIVDGEWAAVVWSETALTAGGEPWANHGIDLIRVEDGKITVLHENNDARLVHRHFPSYS
ncbi:MAG: nuclear transport factor 2 family protein [Acidimicrobiales bacterium]